MKCETYIHIKGHKVDNRIEESITHTPSNMTYGNRTLTIDIGKSLSLTSME